MQQELALHFTPRNKMVNNSKSRLKKVAKDLRNRLEPLWTEVSEHIMDQIKIQEKSRSKILNGKKI